METVSDDLTKFLKDFRKNSNQVLKINNLTTDVSNPALDGPITNEKLNTALDQMGLRPSNTKTIVNVFLPLILLLLNIMFFNTHQESYIFAHRPTTIGVFKCC